MKKSNPITGGIPEKKYRKIETAGIEREGEEEQVYPIVGLLLSDENDKGQVASNHNRCLEKNAEKEAMK